MTFYGLAPCLTEVANSFVVGYHEREVKFSAAGGAWEGVRAGVVEQAGGEAVS